MIMLWRVQEANRRIEWLTNGFVHALLPIPNQRSRGDPGPVRAGHNGSSRTKADSIQAGTPLPTYWKFGIDRQNGGMTCAQRVSTEH
jgi:hypothetical protein